MKGLGYGLLALGALALLSAVLLPAEFDYQDYADTGAPRRLMLGILGGVVFIGGTILVAAQSILDGLRRTPAPTPATTTVPVPVPASPALAAPASPRAIERTPPIGTAGIQRDPSGGNALLISGIVIVALIAVLAVIALAILIMRQQQESDSYDDVMIEANIAAESSPDPGDNGIWAARSEPVGAAPDLAPLAPAEPVGLDKVVPGLDRVRVGRPERAGEPPAAAAREAPARRGEAAPREDPFADPPAASDDPFAD